MNRTENHQKLLDEVMYKVGSEFIIWKQVNGVFRGLYDERKFSIGLDGSGDLTGVLPGGRRLEVEVKSGTGKLSAQQERFKNMIEAHGAVYILARNPEEALAEIKSKL